MKTNDITLAFESCNNGVTLYKYDFTEVRDGYLYNIYSAGWFGAIKRHHKKLKIYKQEPIGGYYVKVQGVRCYINDLVKED